MFWEVIQTVSITWKPFTGFYTHRKVTFLFYRCTYQSSIDIDVIIVRIGQNSSTVTCFFSEGFTSWIKQQTHCVLCHLFLLASFTLLILETNSKLSWELHIVAHLNIIIQSLCGTRCAAVCLFYKGTRPVVRMSLIIRYSLLTVQTDFCLWFPYFSKPFPVRELSHCLMQLFQLHQ